VKTGLQANWLANIGSSGVAHLDRVKLIDPQCKGQFHLHKSIDKNLSWCSAPDERGRKPASIPRCVPLSERNVESLHFPRPDGHFPRRFDSVHPDWIIERHHRIMMRHHSKWSAATAQLQIDEDQFPVNTRYTDYRLSLTKRKLDPLHLTAFQLGLSSEI
jgi:hypothetical protein